MPFNGPVIPFGAMVEYHSISAKEISRLHQFVSKRLARYIPRLCLVRGRNLESRHTLKNWSRWMRLKSTPEGSEQRKC